MTVADILMAGATLTTLLVWPIIPIAIEQVIRRAAGKETLPF